MIGYEKPELVEVSDFMETVNLGSNENEFDVGLTWVDHNSGSHSVLEIAAKFGDTHCSPSIYLNLVDPRRTFARIDACGMGTAEMRQNGRQIKIQLGDVSGNVVFNLQFAFTPGPYTKGLYVESGAYKIPMVYDSNFTLRENIKKMELARETVTVDEIIPYGKKY